MRRLELSLNPADAVIMSSAARTARSGRPHGPSGAEEREHRVTLQLRDRALELVHRLRHQLEGLVDDPSGPPRPSARRAWWNRHIGDQAVTGLRSPVSLAARILSTSGAGAAGQPGLDDRIRIGVTPGFLPSGRRAARVLPPQSACGRLCAPPASLTAPRRGHRFRRAACGTVRSCRTARSGNVRHPSLTCRPTRSAAASSTSSPSAAIPSCRARAWCPPATRRCSSPTRAWSSSRTC